MVGRSVLAWGFGGPPEGNPLMAVGPDLEKDSYCGQHSWAAEGLSRAVQTSLDSLTLDI